jgi:CRP-like cAMP-binding protein
MTIGDQSDSLFVIAEGAVDVIVPIQEGKASMDKVVATLGSGTFVGDRALLLGEKRSATVQAKTQVVCYEVTKKDFEPILKARPAMISGLSEVVLQREASTSAQISEAKKNLPKELNLKQELVKAIQKFFGV